MSLKQDVVRCQLTLQCSERLTEAGRSILKFAYTWGWQVVPDCWCKAPILLYIDLSKGLLEYPHGMVAGFPQVEYLRHQGRSCNASFDLTLVVTVTSVNTLLVTQVSLIQYGSCLHKNMNNRRWWSLGTILEAGYNNHRILSILYEKYLSTLPLLWSNGQSFISCLIWHIFFKIPIKSSPHQESEWFFQ